FMHLSNTKKQGIRGVSPLHNQHGKTQTDDEEIAKILNNQFASVFSQDDGLSPPIGGPVGADIADLIINRNGVLKLLREIDTHKSTGPDEVSARLLHELAEEVADPLVLIFNASLSLTSITCKIMEHVLHSHMINHLEREGILTDTQHGFRKNRSCETQLLQRVDSFAKSLNNKEQVDAILLDFSKAFDKVCHRKLVHKLYHYGIKGKLLNWIEQYLANRTQCVVVRGKSSPRTYVQSGVPQGTVLGPLLFLAYINDMPYSVSLSLALFADDSFLHNIILEITDGQVLQKDLDELSVWETNWSMEFHPKKCKVLRITNKRASKKCMKYTLHNEELEVVDKAKYLGVTISKDLNWKWHINSISAKATNCRLFFAEEPCEMQQRNKVKLLQNLYPSNS
ncbi:MAG: reverse transcriptase family protein, partial [Cyanobacteria bacterium J06649_11]